MNKPCLALAVAMATCAASSAFAATISLNASDGFDASSFSAGTNWTGGLAPSVGNNYVVDNSRERLRTPPNANSHTFAGDSLTIANGFSTLSMNGNDTDDAYGFTYKGLGATGIITINNLILAGGSINHLNGTTDIFQLAGNLSVTGDSIIRAKQGPINVSASISGTSDLYIGASDGGGVRAVTFSGVNSFTGDIITTAASALFILADTGSMSFSVGANGVNNVISGTGSATLNGLFSIDTSAADLTLGNMWNLVTATTKTFGDNFEVDGYTDQGDGVWSDGMFEFDTATGTLALVAIPEPSTYAALAGGLILGVAAFSRRRRVA